MVQPRGHRRREDRAGAHPGAQERGRLRNRGVPAQQGDPVADRSALARALAAAAAAREGEGLPYDPVLFPRRYRDPRDAETAAFVAASFAFGRVARILFFLEAVFASLGSSPHAALGGPGPAPDPGLGHRFISPAGVRRFLEATGDVLREHGSLEALYARGMASPDPRERLSRFLGAFRRSWGPALPRQRDFLFPEPLRGSACKRHHLFLRWVVRPDDGVDLGLWRVLSPRDLIVPLDTHMARIGRSLGLTGRRAADWRAAVDVTDAFRAVSPGDPVRFDYALTRIGILGSCTAARPGPCGECPLAPACAGRPGRN